MDEALELDEEVEVHVYDSREERKLRIERVRRDIKVVGQLYGKEVPATSRLTSAQVRAALEYRRTALEYPGTALEYPGTAKGDHNVQMWSARLGAEARYLSRRIQLFADKEQISRNDPRPLEAFKQVFRMEIEAPSSNAIIFGLISSSQYPVWMFCERDMSVVAFHALIDATLGSKVIPLTNPTETLVQFIARQGIESIGLLEVEIEHKKIKQQINITLPCVRCSEAITPLSMGVSCEKCKQTQTFHLSCSSSELHKSCPLV